MTNPTNAPAEELARLESSRNTCNYEFEKEEMVYANAQEYRAVALALLKEREWISVKDRLPEPGLCLVWRDDIDCPAVSLYGSKFCDRLGQRIYTDVTHWMPKDPS